MASWVLDGSTELELSGDVVKCTPGPASGGNTYNAMWKDGEGVSSGDSYWKVNFNSLDNGAFVGLTNEKKFGKGWAIKGLLYGGNLSNGSGLLVQNYGPRFSAGDSVGILASVSAGKLKVYFDLNGTPLGLAFDIASSILPNCHPVVHFCGAGSATISREAAPPSAEYRSRTKKSYVDVEGPWKIGAAGDVKISGAAFEGEQLGDHLATLTLDPLGGNSYQVSLKVVNHCGFQIEKSGNTWKSAGAAMSTKMLGPPKLMKLEQALSTLAQNPDSVTLVADRLTLKGRDVEAAFVRYDDSPQTYSEDPFA